MFKVGDRVRYVKHYYECDSNYYDIGNIYTIVRSGLEKRFILNHTKGNDKDMFVLEDQIELVESVKTATLTPSYELVIKDQKINLTKSELYDLMEVVKGELNES